MVARIRQQQGFILFASIWMMAILLIMAGFFAQYSEQQVEQAIAVKQRLASEVDRHNTLQLILYRLATQRMTYAGLTTKRQAFDEYHDAEGHLLLDPIGGEIRLDGSTYQGYGNSFFSLQDQNGLISVNSRSKRDLLQILQTIQNGQKNNTVISDKLTNNDHLIATLIDYIDEDDLAQLNGAEKYLYTQQNLPIPSNYYLRSVAELYRVYGWPSWLENQPQFQLEPWLSTRFDGRINLNTLPQSLLPYLFFDQQKNIPNIIKQRQLQPFRSIDDFILRTGINNGIARYDEENFVFFSSNRLKITLGSSLNATETGQQARQVQIISIQLTAQGLMGPWLIDYSYTTTQHSVNNMINDENGNYDNMNDTQTIADKYSKYGQSIQNSQEPFFQSALLPEP